MESIKTKIDAVLPWIGGLETEKELILLSAMGGNPDTDKIGGGRINLLFVTEPDLFVEQLVNGVKHWAKNVSYAYFDYYPVDVYMPLSEQIPISRTTGCDMVHLVVNRDSKTDNHASRAVSYFKYLNEDQPDDFLEKISFLRSLKPALGQKEKDLIVHYYTYLRKLQNQQIKKSFQINSRTVIALKNIAEARAKLAGRSAVAEEDVERSASHFINTLKMMGIEEEKDVVDYFNEEQRVKWQRQKINELYAEMKKSNNEGYISRESIRRLGRRLGMTSNESDECMKIMQESGYIAPEINDKVKVL